jgi:hypothetical protein
MLYVRILAHGNYTCHSKSQLVHLNLPDDSEVVILRADLRMWQACMSERAAMGCAMLPSGTGPSLATYVLESADATIRCRLQLNILVLESVSQRFDMPSATLSSQRGNSIMRGHGLVGFNDDNGAENRVASQWLDLWYRRSWTPAQALSRHIVQKAIAVYLIDLHIGAQCGDSFKHAYYPAYTCEREMAIVSREPQGSAR